MCQNGALIEVALASITDDDLVLFSLLCPGGITNHWSWGQKLVINSVCWCNREKLSKVIFKRISLLRDSLSKHGSVLNFLLVTNWEKERTESIYNFSLSAGKIWRRFSIVSTKPLITKEKQVHFFLDDEKWDLLDVIFQTCEGSLFWNIRVLPNLCCHKSFAKAPPQLD